MASLQNEFELRAVERALARIQRVLDARGARRVLRARFSARSHTSSRPTRFGGRSENLTRTSSKPKSR